MTEFILFGNQSYLYLRGRIGSEWSVLLVPGSHSCGQAGATKSRNDDLDLSLYTKKGDNVEPSPIPGTRDHSRVGRIGGGVALLLAFFSTA